MGTGQQRRQKMLVLRKVSLPHLSFHSRRIQSCRVTNWPGLSNTVPVLALKQASQDSWSLTSQSSFLLNRRLLAPVGHSSHVSCFATAGSFSKDGLEDEKKPQEHHLCGWFQGDLAVETGVKRRLNWALYRCGGRWAGGPGVGECERRLWARMEDEGSMEESVWLQGPLIVLCGDASQAGEGRGGDQPGLLPLDMNYLGTFVSCISPFCFKCVIFTLPRNLSLQRFHSKLVVLNLGCTGRSPEKLLKCSDPDLDHVNQNL